MQQFIFQKKIKSFLLSGGLSSGDIVGIVFGVIAFGLLFVATGALLYMRFR